MRFLFSISLMVLGLTFSGCQQSGVAEKTNGEAATQETTSRKFEFHYGATIKDAPKDATIRIWFPIAQSSAQQTVKQTSTETPGDLQVNSDTKYGNRIGFFESKSTETPMSFELTYEVDRLEASVDNADQNLSDDQKKLFLSANSLVPIDGKPQELLKDTELPEESMAAGEKLYDIVENHMKYDKSVPGYGKGDAVWACDSQTGNCTDFHSLFISLARSKNIPARFEIGFPLPGDKTEGTIGGYHCWAWFHAEGTGWAPVDISEADKHPELKDFYFGKLTADRIAFSKGRDIELIPKSENGPLNYFVYPHVEVDGKVWPKDKIELNFSFKNK